MKSFVTALVLALTVTTTLGSMALAANEGARELTIEGQYYQQRQNDFDSSCVQQAEIALGIRPGAVAAYEVREVPLVTMKVVTDVYLKLRSGRIAVYRLDVSAPF